MTGNPARACLTAPGAACG